MHVDAAPLSSGAPRPVRIPPATPQEIRRSVLRPPDSSPPQAVNRTPGTPPPRLSYHRLMVGADILRELFLTSSQMVAFSRCLPDAERQRRGVVLTLNYSQAARDGLEAAARAFARFADQRGVRGEAARRLAISMAKMAPTHVWWRPLFESSRPHVLGREDVWKSLAELRMICADVSGSQEEPGERQSA